MQSQIVTKTKVKINENIVKITGIEPLLWINNLAISATRRVQLLHAI